MDLVSLALTRQLQILEALQTKVMEGVRRVGLVQAGEQVANGVVGAKATFSNPAFSPVCNFLLRSSSAKTKPFYIERNTLQVID